jgi:LppP/LprE lipoprotein
MRQAASTAIALVLGLTGGALLGGCGSGTRTVTESGAPTPTTATVSTATRTVPAAKTTTTPPSTTSSSSQGAGEQTATATRTAPGPAFAQHGGAPAEAAGEEAAAAVAVVKSHGYTPSSTSEYHPKQTLRVIVGTLTGSADGYNQRAFFFLDGRYIGTDTSQPSASIRVVSQSDTEVTLGYALYRPGDPLYRPGGGEAVVHFQLNDGQLTPLQPIPPASSSTGNSRQ